MLSCEKLKFIDDLMPGLTGSGAVLYTYESIECSEYETLIDSCLNTVDPVQNPEFLQIAGIPGSGKTTFLNKLNLSNYLIIGFDMIMDKMESYKLDVKKFGLEIAFKNNELPARIIGYEILVRALKKRVNIILEHSGMLENHFDLIKNINLLGYKTRMIFIRCPLDVAVNRTKSREAEIKRHTPENIIIERYNKADKFLKQYEKLFQKLEFIESCD